MSTPIKGIKLFKPLDVRLVKRTPERAILLGIHYRGFSDSGYIKQTMLPVNMIEIKPEYFKGEDTLFSYVSGKFQPVRKNLDRLFLQASEAGLQVQWHFPVMVNDIMLNPGEGRHGDRIYSLFETIATEIKDHDLLPNITIHPPNMMWNGKPTAEGITAGEALKNSNDIMMAVSNDAKTFGWPIRIGVENQADPKKDANVLGYKIDHLEAMSAGTNDIVGFTIDSGHRLLASDLYISRDIIPLASSLEKTIVNFHFHENQGIVTDSYKDDIHALPLGRAIPGYLNFLNRAVQERVPIVFEVNTKRHKWIEVLVAFYGVKSMMEKIETERLSN